MNLNPIGRAVGTLFEGLDLRWNTPAQHLTVGHFFDPAVSRQALASYIVALILGREV